MRAVFQSGALLLVVFGFVAYQGYQEGFNLADLFYRTSEMDYEEDFGRDLQAQLCSEMKRADPFWMITFYIIGVLYTFLGLAIVCDEFFVPALEEMAGPRRMNLSMDVAGATLMAAGGSAPELFSSLFGTFAETDIGIGTIIGSAVFNVMFVIGVCALFSNEVLTLTWWPLFRDSFCYAVGLVVLMIVVGVSSKEEIFLWEACILFVMYLLYIIIMWKNADIYRFLTGLELEPDEEEEEDSGHLKGDPRWPGTFRAGILGLIRHPENWVATAGVGIVARMAGNADQVFEDVDADKSGYIDKDELRVLFEKLDITLSEEELEEAYK
jgi:Ca2+/H+ antiporter